MSDEEIKHWEDSYAEVAARDLDRYFYEQADWEDAEWEGKEK